MGKWKALTGREMKGLELYDLEKDPTESRNIAVGNAKIVLRAKSLKNAAYIEPRPQIEPKKPTGKQYQ